MRSHDFTMMQYFCGSLVTRSCIDWVLLAVSWSSVANYWLSIFAKTVWPFTVVCNMANYQLPLVWIHSARKPWYLWRVWDATHTTFLYLFGDVAVEQLDIDLVHTWMKWFHFWSVTVRMHLRMMMNFGRIVYRWSSPISSFWRGVMSGLLFTCWLKPSEVHQSCLG